MRFNYFVGVGMGLRVFKTKVLVWTVGTLLELAIPFKECDRSLGFTGETKVEISSISAIAENLDL